ncbi:MAG: endonuclease/exonuclease/phosphatase family protein [Tidjanibacter sp.]|nr:endonuclease/exonuclease/phosphatase family protein [Tidjanibacter sp.]
MLRLRYILAAILMILTSFNCKANSTNGDIKVISYNIRLAHKNDGENYWENRKHASVNMIRTEEPTIIGLQELLKSQLDYLTKELTEYAFIGVGRDNGVEAGEFMAIFYRTEDVDLLDWGTFWLSQTPEVPSRGWDAMCRRTCTWAKFRHKATGKTFMHFNTHLDHVGNVARREGLRLIVERMGYMVDHTTPTFLTGDFNIPTDNEAFEMLTPTLQDARKVSPKSDHRATFNGWGNASSIIDHIFFRGATAHTFQVLCDENYGAPYISDHYPVVLTATLK